MVRSVAVAIGVLVSSAGVLAAQNLGSITGTVRDTAGVALAEAEVILANKRVLTTPQGGFRFDSLPVGTHLITIRLVGYAALRSPVTVRTGISYYNYVLHPAARVLPPLYAEARRSGIYGTVGDTSYTPLAGVRVQLAGRGGGDAFTDASGHFAFPSAIEGQYVVRAVHPGYAEERLFIELKKREGVALAIRLRPSREMASRADEVAVYDLGRRLVANLSGDRLSASQLNRYGSLGLCEVSRIARRIRASTDGLTIIVNGTTVLEQRSARDLCSWQAAEVELVEFGDTICRDVTRTLVDMLNVWCTKFTKGPVDFRGSGTPFPGGSGGRIRTQRSGGPFVVIWERR
ncbi:MAG TPA: carboxypeptidase-like regulatory domain-containing protein [Candidatus Binatia bacterium]|jgi:hypothetical protein|nr:carboxypeptidase-like regulatory domain-containing protein [Candidatus Binatia bacterium]